LVGFGYIASFAVLVAAGCGGAGSNPEIECAEGVCPCNEGGIRAAIAEGLGPYTFDCDGPTTVRTGREIVIDRDVTLDGGGSLTLDGNRAHRVFSVPEGVTAELIGLTVANGNQTEEHGGGIRNEGTLTLTNSTVSGSSTGRDSGCRTDDLESLCSEGGGIWNAGTLTLMDSTVSGNSAPFGGGIANRGRLTLNDSTVLTNSAEGCRVGAVLCSGGGGIWNSGTLTMLDSTVSGSRADWGAGIYNRGVPSLTNTTVSGNSAGFDGGGLLNFETLTLINSTVADNNAGQSGGGIANEAGILEVTNSTLTGNIAASAGGGMFNPSGAAADLLNTTLSGNSAETGGGIYTGGELTLTSSTMAGNAAPDASAIYDPGTSDATPRSIANTLIAGDCAGEPFDSGGYNVESPGDTCGFNQATDRPAEDQLNLGPLQDNDGPTKTHALLENSVAIDRIPKADCVDGAGEPLTADQRGEPRPAGASSTCDVGAFEVQPVGMVDMSGSN
jgi:predicted outer membrane repeat protein